MDRPHIIASGGHHWAVKRILGSYRVHIWPYLNFVPQAMQVRIPPATTLYDRWHHRSTDCIHSPYMEEHAEARRDGAADPRKTK